MSDLQNMLKEEIAEGGEEAIIGEASDMVLDLAEETIGDYTFGSMALNSEMGRELVKAVFGAGLYFLVKSGLTPDSLPVSDAKLARVFRIVERNAARRLIRPHMKTVREYMEEAAGLAKELPEPDDE